MKQAFLHLPSSGEPVYFSHANGFPAGVYGQFLHTLNKKFDVTALQSRATHEDAGDPEHADWHIFADDLIRHIETQGKPVIAIGHSLGASSTILAAIKRPDLFKALVLIEPAMLSLPLSLAFKLLPKKIINDSKLVQGTLNKRDTWSTREEYLSYIKKFKGYQKFNDQGFSDFAENALRDSNGILSLAYPKAWEAHNYTLAPYLMKELGKLDKLDIPTVAIRGKPNLFFSNKLWVKWRSKQAAAMFLEDEKFSHLFPLEGPEECTALIQKGLTALGIS
jgi:pimeloyl-ACP methyl ester carboxylesterase